MQKSDSIGALASALSKLQGEVQDAHKDKKGYGYSYADLSSVLDIARPLCAKNGLSITQLCSNALQDGVSSVGVETVLMHSSGEWLSSTLYMPVVAGKGMSGAQAAGSVITYARRYALAAILGIAQTDDDAAIDKKNDVGCVNSDTVASIMAHISALGVEVDEVNTWLTRAKVSKLEQLSQEQGLKLLAMLEKRGNE